MVGGGRMRNPLRKRYPRDLRRNFGRYFSIFVMLTVTISIMSSFFAVSSGAQKSLEENRIICKVEDGLFSSYNEISSDTILDIEELGVSVYENYYLDEKINDKTVLRVYKNRENINLVTAMKGRLPKKSNEIAIERLFAENNNIALGDTITVQEADFTITGYVCMPDYSALFQKNSDLMMDAYHFGIGIVTEEAFARFPNSALIYNYSYYYNDRDLSEDEKRNLSNDILESLVENKTLLTNFLTAENNQSISMVQTDLTMDVPLMKVLLNIVIVIMAFVFSIVISSTIDAEAPIIGTLLSSGYGKYELIGHYMGLPIIVTFLSALIGNLLGYFAIPDLFKNIYYDSFSVPPLDVRIDPEALFLTTISPILIMICINFITLYRKLSISPISFLRRDIKKKNNKKPIKLPNLSFLSRFRLRVIIQNKSNYLLLFIGIFFASVILMFGLCIVPLVDNYVDSIKSSTISQYQYILKSSTEAINEESAEKFTFNSLKTFYKPRKDNIEVAIYGIGEGSKYLPELPLTNDNEGVYFSDGLAKKLNNKIGDMVEFVDPYTGNKYDLKVVGICDYPAAPTVFINQKQLNTLLGYDKEFFNGYFSNTKLQFEDEYNLATVITPEDMVKLGEQMTSSFSQIEPICLAMAVIVYLLLMYVLTKIVIEKNSLYISFMKVFGYEEKEIKKLYLSTTTMVVVVSLLITLPLVSYTIEKCMEVALVMTSGYIPFYIPSYLYAQLVATGLISYFIINFFHKKKVYKIDMAAALKNRD